VIIKAVLFDLDGTLYDRDALVLRLLTEQFQAFESQLPAVPMKTFVSRLVELDDHGYRDKSAVYRIAGREWSLASRLCEQLEHDFWMRYDTHCVLDDDVDHTLTTLRQRGLKLAVVTNGGAERQQRKLDALGISGCFDAILISEVEGVRKPDPEIFARALDRCHVEASNALFVGDHPEVDVGGAVQAGLHAVWKVTPYWRCGFDVPFIHRLSEILPMCDGGRVSYVLRQATAADMPSMYRAHCLGLGPYITQFRGWDETKEREYFFGRFIAAECQMILVEGEHAGWCRIEDNADHFRLDYFVLAPEH
jgi:putative hydrolase of the HAD superfamily